MSGKERNKRVDEPSPADGCTSPEQFEAIVNEYQAPLLRYATRILHNSSAAQDVVQNTFIRLFTHWRPGTSPTPQLSAWLYRVAHNCAVDYIRRETRRKALIQKHSDAQQAIAATDKAGVSEAAEKAVKALRKLSLREQQLVILKVYEELSYREIAEITGLSQGNVGYILHHAMKKLAGAMEAERKGPKEDRK